MSTPHIPAPAPAPGAAPQQPHQLQHQQQPVQTSTAITDPEVLLRHLAPEQWEQMQQMQQMPPPPTPIASLAASEALVQSSQSPTPDAVTPKAATATRSRAKGKSSARSTRKRKPASSNAIKEESDNASSEEFTLENIKTKSGRKVHRPAHFDPAIKTPSRRRGPYRRNHDARICKICQRGHSPQSNMIVFCDGCNTPYHQLCHDPPIDDLVIAVTEAEWFCSLCAKKREEKVLTTGMSGENLTDDEKRTYLASLPLSSLVELIFFCEQQHPDLPLYDPQTKIIVESIKSASVAAITKDTDTGTPNINGDGGVVEGEVEIFNNGSPNWEDMIVRAIISINDERGSQAKVIFEWLSNNYPALEGRDVRTEAQGSLQTALRKNRLIRDGFHYKLNHQYVSKTSLPLPTDPIPVLAPGSGIKLPPETEDDQTMLVDDDLVAFSHRVYDININDNNHNNAGEQSRHHHFQQQQQQGHDQDAVDDGMTGMDGIGNGHDADGEGEIDMGQGLNGISEEDGAEMSAVNTGG